ncbi:MAG: SDR family oxidoreductase [Actinobacteria bacterium]|nr:SDR family oxidoreductase [Actinomycetota bacterium]
MGLLDGHRALVTGGASGIGRATARRMTEEGAVVAVLDVDEAGAKAVADEIGGHAFAVDVTDAGATERAVQDAASALGGLSIAFNNAGVGWIQPLHEYDLGQWDRVLQVSLYGVFHGLRAEVPIMLERGDGRIVNTASISGTRPAAGEGAYSAAKAAIAALTASAALEYAPTIRVNAVSPGHVNSALTAPLDEMLPDHVAGIIAKTPVGRAGEPEDIADVVVFLCSDQSRFLTGQNLVVDGGLTLHTSGTDGLLQKVQALLPPTGAGEGSA